MFVISILRMIMFLLILLFVISFLVIPRMMFLHMFMVLSLVLIHNFLIIMLLLKYVKDFVFQRLMIRNWRMWTWDVADLTSMLRFGPKMHLMNGDSSMGMNMSITDLSKKEESVKGLVDMLCLFVLKLLKRTTICTLQPIFFLDLIVFFQFCLFFFFLIYLVF